MVGDGAAASLLLRNHHLDAVGAQHVDGGAVDGGIKEALHTAQHQTHPVTAWTLGRHHYGPAIPEGLRGQRRQQPLHRLQLGPQQTRQPPPAGEGLQGGAGVGPQGGEQGPQPLRVGQQGKEQLAKGALGGAAQLRRIQLGPGGFDQLVVADAGGTGRHAGEAAQAGVEMAGHRRIQLQLTGGDRLEGMDAAAGGIHLRGQHPIAGAGRQAEAAVHTGVSGAGVGAGKDAAGGGGAAAGGGAAGGGGAGRCGKGGHGGQFGSPGGVRGGFRPRPGPGPGPGRWRPGAGGC